MKKPTRSKKSRDEMRAEYKFDYSTAVRGKYFRADAKLILPVYLEPDVAEVFRDSAAVNEALRSLLKISKTTRRSNKPASRRASGR